MTQIARETGAIIGGRIFSDSLSDANGPAATYLDMMRHNLRAFMEALR
jgi:zinc/manganese transport system substrate-binding protein